MASCFWRRLILLMGLCFFMPSSLWAGEGRAVPTYEECRRLADPKTSTKDKVLLQLSFFPRTPWCEINTRPFFVLPLFSQGIMEARLKLVVTPRDAYEIDPSSLMAALLPDRSKASGTRAAQSAAQTFSMIAGAMNATVDPVQFTFMLAQMGALAGTLGANAAHVEEEIAALRTRHHFPEEAILVPSWLHQLAEGKSIKHALEGREDMRPPKTFAEKFFRALGKWLRLLGLGKGSMESDMLHDVMGHF